MSNFDELIAGGSTAAKNGAFDEARESFEDALKLDPCNEFAWYGRVFALRKLGQREAAESALDSAFQVLPPTARLLVERGMLAFDEPD